MTWKDGGPPVSKILHLGSVGLPLPYSMPVLIEGGQEGNERRKVKQ